MAAPLHDHRTVTTTDPVARFFALEPAPVGSPPADVDRPALRVIPGGREAALRHRQPPAVYRARRRVAALVALSLLVATIVGLVVATRAMSAPGSVEPPVASDAGPPVAVDGGMGTASLPASYVVQPGDSLWSIAEALEPRGDIRPLVDELARRAGPGVLEAGTRLDLRGLGG